MRCLQKLPLARPTRAAALTVAGACAGVLVTASPLGCGSTRETGFNTPADGGIGAARPDATPTFVDDSGVTGSFGGDSGSGDDGATSSSDCPGGAGKYIYVISDQNELYTFDPTQAPATTAFTDLGPINCPGEPTPPPDNGGVNSMAVDRQAIAWINFNDGNLFKVDTTQTSLPCSATNFSEGNTGFTPQLGMGFATVSSTNTSETLYVSDNGGPGGACMSTTPGPGCMGLGLGSINQTTMTLGAIGPYTSTVAGYNAELSGTGDGILYGFFTTTPSTLGTIDPKSGAVTDIIPLPSVNNSVGGYAFSFWGGDFWIYTAFPTDADPNATTSVTHYVSADGGVGVVMPDIGFTIVGAGASTCVPTTPIQ